VVGFAVALLVVPTVVTVVRVTLQKSVFLFARILVGTLYLVLEYPSSLYLEKRIKIPNEYFRQ